MMSSVRPTLGPKLALSRLKSPLEIMFKFPYLAQTRTISHKLAHSRDCKVDSNFNGSDPFNKLQTGLTEKSGPTERWTICFRDFSSWTEFSEIPEILVERITPNTLSHAHGKFTINLQKEDAKNTDSKNYKQYLFVSPILLEFPIASVVRVFHQ